MAVSVLGSLPEFSRVGAREESEVFLALMLKDGHFLEMDFIGSERDD